MVNYSYSDGKLAFPTKGARLASLHCPGGNTAQAITRHENIFSVIRYETSMTLGKLVHLGRF